MTAAKVAAELARVAFAEVPASWHRELDEPGLAARLKTVRPVLDAYGADLPAGTASADTRDGPRPPGGADLRPPRHRGGGGMDPLNPTGLTTADLVVLGVRHELPRAPAFAGGVHTDAGSPIFSQEGPAARGLASLDAFYISKNESEVVYPDHET
ncbi:hypothetical protein [Streptomyces sp. NPDC054952]